MDSPSQTHHIYEFGTFRLLTRERVLRCEGASVNLSAKAFDGLLLLLERGSEMLSKEEMMQRLWPDTAVSENSLAQLISSLRKTLSEHWPNHRLIETVSGRGYRFVARVQSKPDTNELSPPAVDTLSAHRAGHELTSLAVLPFRLLSAASHDEYLALGMADTLITRLSNATQLIVRPTSAVSGLGNAERDGQLLGRKLNVAAVLEGSLQRDGERLRVTVQLVRVGDGAVLWATKFDEQFTDIFAVQDTIAEQVVRALALQLSDDGQRLLAIRQTESHAAHLAYLKGRYFLSRRTEEGLKNAVRYFQQAIAHDPTYALAYAGLADAFIIPGVLHVAPPRETYPKAKAAVRQALEINPSLAEAYASLGMIRFYFDWDWAGSAEALQHAIALNPNDVEAHYWYGWLLVAQGKTETALEELHYAQELDPLSLIIGTLISGALFYQRQYEHAAEQSRKVLEMEPGFALAHHCLSRIYLAQQRYDQAIEAAQTALKQMESNLLMIATLGLIQAQAGNPVEARRALQELHERANYRYVTAHFPAVIYTALQEYEQAFACFERAVEERCGYLVWLNTDPMFDNLRSDPRFHRLLEQVGFWRP